MERTEFLDNFEKTLEAGLLKVCSGAGLLEDKVLGSTDIDEAWERYIKDYIGDAVVNFNGYPDAAVAWAAFLGMGVAYNWDLNWRLHYKDKYTDYYGSRGWDDMDEHILHDLLGLKLDGPEAMKISDTMLSCATATLGLIRHEGVESQTEEGFYVLARAYTVMFRIGAAVELKRLKYNMIQIGGEA